MSRVRTPGASCVDSAHIDVDSKFTTTTAPAHIDIAIVNVMSASMCSLSPDLVAHVIDSCGSTFEERWHACVTLACVCTSTRHSAFEWASVQPTASMCTRLEPPQPSTSPLTYSHTLPRWIVETRAFAHVHTFVRCMYTCISHQITPSPALPPRWNVSVLATRCVALTHVTLADACNADVVALARHCPMLAYVDVHECGKVTDVGVVALACAACARKLQFLWLCNDASTPTRDAITDTSLIELGRLCPNLEQLHMHRVRRWSPSSRVQITHVGISALVRGCPKLTQIDMSRLAVTTEAFNAIAAHCTHLSHLNVAHCEYFDDVVASNFASAECASSLRHLDVRSCASLTERGISRLALKCSNLEHVEVWGKVGDDAIDAIAHNCNRTLKTLHFTSSIVRSVDALTHKCTHLRSLSLTTDRVWSLGADPRCTLLEHLSADCRSLTNDGVNVLVERCTHLQTVNLIRCRLVTDDAVTTLAHHHAQSLRTLKLVGMPRLSDRGILALGLHNCTHLTELYIGFCERVSDAPINSLATGCPNLTVLHMWYCERSSYDATRTLERTRTHIAYLREQQRQRQRHQDQHHQQKNMHGARRVKWMSL